MLSISFKSPFIAAWSFFAASSVAFAASWAFFIIPLSLNIVPIVIPANINNTIIVTTNDINVTPLFFISSLSVFIFSFYL